MIIGNALSGEKHYLTALRIMFPDLARELERAASFAALPADVRSTIEGELHANLDAWLPVITEDTMPGELGNCIAGRVANLFNLHGPNFTTDAACASALAAMDATVDGLLAHEFDVAITGGVDRNMGAHTFVKFCAIGALSPSGTRPYSEGADGFVMGEGAALFVVKRLADAVRAGDRIYAVVRGVGSASDGKGKGITAPNPVGQRFAVERAWRNAGLSPAECTLIEGHGTSTSVGDAVELSSLMEAFSGAHVAPGSIALGSVKSNIGHLKGGGGSRGHAQDHARAARQGAAAEPQLRAAQPNLDWTASPFAVNTELRDWDVAADRARVAGVSAFGFGGTNFHLVMEEYMPDRHTHQRRSLLGRRCRRRSSPCAASEPRGPAPGEAAAARRARARRRGRGGARQRAADRAGGGTPGTPPRSDASQQRRAARARADRDRLRRRPRPGGEGGAGVAGAAMRATPPPGRRCAHAASTAAAAAPARWRSCTPARALSTRTCSPSCAGESPWSRSCSRRPTRSWLRCSRAAAYPTSCSPTRRIRRRWRGRRRSSAGPRSSSRP